jgi:hypothetical protein
MSISCLEAILARTCWRGQTQITAVLRDSWEKISTPANHVAACSQGKGAKSIQVFGWFALLACSKPGTQL